MIHKSPTWRCLAALLALGLRPATASGQEMVIDATEAPLLEIRYTGDVARLYAGGELLMDNFFNGLPWRIGLKRYADALRRGPLELRILPLRADAPVFIPPSLRPADFGAGGQRAEVQAVEAIPEYELVVAVPPARR
jgi:beta-galactosidase